MGDGNKQEDETNSDGNLLLHLLLCRCVRVKKRNEGSIASPTASLSRVGRFGWSTACPFLSVCSLTHHRQQLKTPPTPITQPSMESASQPSQSQHNHADRTQCFRYRFDLFWLSFGEVLKFLGLQRDSQEAGESSPDGSRVSRSPSSSPTRAVLSTTFCLLFTPPDPP